MTSDIVVEDWPGQVTLAEAETRFQEAMVLLGWAAEELRSQVEAGDLPNTSDIKDASKELGEAWRAAQKERERVAEYRRKKGELVDGDIDLDAARDAICQQLDRIADSLKEN